MQTAMYNYISLRLSSSLVS